MPKQSPKSELLQQTKTSSPEIAHSRQGAADASAQQNHPPAYGHSRNLRLGYLTAHDILQLQRTVGNRAVGRLLQQSARVRPLDNDHTALVHRKIEISMPPTLYKELPETIHSSISDYNSLESLLFKKDMINPFALGTEESDLPISKKLEINYKMLEKLHFLDDQVETWIDENTKKSPYKKRMLQLESDITSNYIAVYKRLKVLVGNKTSASSAYSKKSGVIKGGKKPFFVKQTLMSQGEFDKRIKKPSTYTRDISTHLRDYMKKELAYDFESSQQDDLNEWRNAERIALLGRIERFIYKWFDRAGKSEQDSDAESMIFLLKQIQTAHQDEIALLIQQRWKFKTQDWEDLSQTEEAEVRIMWHRVTTGTANVKIEDQSRKEITQGAFAKQSYAAFARLLSTKTGRSLFRRILTNSTGKTVTIRDMGRNTIFELGGSVEPAAAKPTSEKAARDPSKGSSSTIGVVSDFEDTELWVKDKGGNTILCPAWLTLGHELIHAVHQMEGVDKSDDDEVAEGWTDKEEAQTIGQITADDIKKMSWEDMMKLVMANDSLRKRVKRRLKGAQTKTAQTRIVRYELIAFYSLSENQLRKEVGLTRRGGHSGDWVKAPTSPESLQIGTLDSDRRGDYDEIPEKE